MREDGVDEGGGARKAVLGAEVDTATWPQRQGNMLRSWFARRWAEVDVAVNVSWLGPNLRVHMCLICLRSPDNNARLGRSVCTHRWQVRNRDSKAGGRKVVVYNRKRRSRPAAITGVVGRRMDEGSAKQQANHGRL
jgi:hypothetical protein